MPAIVLNSKKQLVKVQNKQMYVTRVLRYSTIPYDSFIKHVAADSGLSEAVATTAVGAITKQVKQMLLNGHSFPMGNLFYLRYGFKCKSAATAKECTAKKIYQQHIVCRPVKDFDVKLKEVQKSITIS